MLFLCSKRSQLSCAQTLAKGTRSLIALLAISFTTTAKVIISDEERP